MRETKTRCYFCAKSLEQKERKSGGLGILVICMDTRGLFMEGPKTRYFLPIRVREKSIARVSTRAQFDHGVARVYSKIELDIRYTTQTCIQWLSN